MAPLRMVGDMSEWIAEGVVCGEIDNVQTARNQPG